MHNLNLQQGERLLVHRGVSWPICPNAERGKMAANQVRGGFSHRIAGVLYGVSKPDGEVTLRLHSISKVAVKTIGEPNALIQDQDSPFKDWWCHVVQVDGTDFGLIGRPNRIRLGGRYEIGAPHLVSTAIWREALQCLPDQAKDYKHDVRAAKYPQLAASFYNSRSGLDRSFLDSI